MPYPWKKYSKVNNSILKYHIPKRL
jgi:hypothetical protein